MSALRERPGRSSVLPAARRTPTEEGGHSLVPQACGSSCLNPTRDLEETQHACPCCRTRMCIRTHAMCVPLTLSVPPTAASAPLPPRVCRAARGQHAAGGARVAAAVPMVEAKGGQGPHMAGERDSNGRGSLHEGPRASAAGKWFACANLVGTRPAWPRPVDNYRPRQ